MCIFEWFLGQGLHRINIAATDNERGNVMHYIAMSERDDPELVHAALRSQRGRDLRQMLYDRSSYVYSAEFGSIFVFLMHILL